MPSTASLELKISQLTKELASKNELIEKHQNTLSQFQQAITCQICLDLMHKPYALAPCGHLACYDCLVQWFKAPPADGRGPAPPAQLRKKICPHCRTVVKERPVEVWDVKNMASGLSKSGLVSLPEPIVRPTNNNAGGSSQSASDPWAGIFRKSSGIDLDFFHPMMRFGFGREMDDPPPPGQVADLGMLDVEDGGIYRCLDCMHEIWDGVCSSCGRVYPGHHPESDEDDDDGWNERVDEIDDMGEFVEGAGYDLAGAGWGWDEEDEDDVDVDDDEDVEEDDVPWWFMQRHQGRGPIQHEFEEADIDGEEDEDNEENGYESSFIDDEDGGTHPGILTLAVTANGDVYEFPNRQPAQEARIVEIPTDSEDESVEEDALRQQARALGRGVRSRHSAIVISSGSEAEEDNDDGGGVASSPSVQPIGGGVRSRRVVMSEGEDDSQSEVDPDLAGRVAARERELYGDDGSLARPPAHLSRSSRIIESPTQSDSDSVAELYADEERPWREYSDDDGRGEDDSDHEGVALWTAYDGGEDYDDGYLS
ncbi:hypothetical protein SERLA73DRAFT_179065 [Serpula lacrymans var. lacrymans S7.3]|uniref:RING-type domain-containing protein n=2 Tax=Serpula lacrymans var. lacrymans TaxID=341189 RepID=F8PTN4_SERL3|nr:uncharacterized protein SERLADRAFT_464013 [Serpula lacrymans var. lacrymans S7.9]EGO01029.1 hypothetical protein SERLA73DRAFT_179065 [Serpula lacrymans var. lacrymans S7.3]EGO26695.1 hypothetical protein SERLADRAFT_464013 [Serpula lacrymans var. lacrymans S7.9]